MSLEKNSGWSRINSPSTTYSIKEFDNQIHLINQLGEVFTVHKDGSLALLAMGALGHEALHLARKKNV